jgi:hypothetical protein
VCQTSENCSIELRIARAYVRLSFAPQDNNGLKTVSLARIGSYEVWLSEFAQGHADCDAQFWVELYDHDLRYGIDSCSCLDLEEAAGAAKELIWRARELNTNPRSGATTEEDE